MKLINTIEIEPSDYELNNYERPNGTIEEKRDEWSELWFKCVSDSGLNNIKPIESGSWFVDISQLTKNDLEIIIKKHIEDVNLSNFEEEMVALSGGIVIQNNNEILIEPTCCGDISDIQNWEEIRNTELNKWTQLWIGHPWVFYKKKDNYITISDYTDYNLEDFKDISEKHKFSEQELLSEIKSSRNCQIDFENRISEILVEMEIKNANEIAKLMTENE